MAGQLLAALVRLWLLPFQLSFGYLGFSLTHVDTSKG